MEPVASVVDKLKGFGKTSQDFFAGLIQRNENSARRNPIEILKRLQREAFADLMKLRDRQDKVERMISFYRSSKGSPFQETSTHVRGEVDVLGAILMMDNVDQQNFDALSRAVTGYLWLLFQWVLNAGMLELRRVHLIRERVSRVPTVIQ